MLHIMMMFWRRILMANPRQSNAKSLAELRAQREKAKKREVAKEKRDGAAVRKKYKSKKKPK